MYVCMYVCINKYVCIHMDDCILGITVAARIPISMMTTTSSIVVKPF